MFQLAEVWDLEKVKLLYKLVESLLIIGTRLLPTLTIVFSVFFQFMYFLNIYCTSLGGSTFAINLLSKRGIIRPLPSKDKLVQMYKDRKEDTQQKVTDKKQELQERVIEKKHELQEKVNEKKQEIQDKVKEKKQEIEEKFKKSN